MQYEKKPHSPSKLGTLDPESGTPAGKIDGASQNAPAIAAKSTATAIENLFINLLTSAAFAWFMCWELHVGSRDFMMWLIISFMTQPITNHIALWMVSKFKSFRAG